MNQRPTKQLPVTNGNGKKMENGGFRKFMFAVVATICASVVLGVGSNALIHAEWRGTVNEKLTHYEMMEKDAKIALEVAKQHGEELLLLRQELASIRSLLSANRSELLEALKLMTVDRFSGNDWKREKEIILLRFDQLKSQVDGLAQQVRALRDDLKRN